MRLLIDLPLKNSHLSIVVKADLAWPFEPVQPEPGGIIEPVSLMDHSCMRPGMTQPNSVDFEETWRLDRFLKPRLGCAR